MVFRRCSALALLSLVLTLGASQPETAGMLPSSAGDASQLADTSEQLLQEIRAFKCKMAYCLLGKEN